MEAKKLKPWSIGVAIVCTALLLALIAFSCTNTENEEQQINTAKEEMTEFFGSVLMDNFGRKDNQAVKWLLEGIRQYNFNYILAVDREKMKKINDRCRPVLQSYVFDYKKMADKFIKPENWPQYQSFNPYAPMSITDFRKDQNAYWQKEVKTNEKQFFKDVAENFWAIGAHAYTATQFTIGLHIDKNTISVSDKDVLTFLTFCFWEYLCYCANLDVVTGQDKTENIMLQPNFKI